MCHHPMCDDDSAQAFAISSFTTYLWLTALCFLTLPLLRREPLRAGRRTVSHVSFPRFMKRPATKPKTPRGKAADGTDFFRKASAAMRRAQKAAERENARYGMKLVLAES